MLAMTGGAGAGDQIQPQRGEHRPLGGAALQDRGVQLPLQRDDAGREGRLRHRAGASGPAKMAVVGERDEIAQLLRAGQRSH